MPTPRCTACTRSRLSASPRAPGRRWRAADRNIGKGVSANTALVCKESLCRTGLGNRSDSSAYGRRSAGTDRSRSSFTTEGCSTAEDARAAAQPSTSCALRLSRLEGNGVSVRGIRGRARGSRRGRDWQAVCRRGGSMIEDGGNQKPAGYSVP